LVDLGFLSTGKKEKSIFDGILRLLDTVVEAVDFFESTVDSFGRGDVTGADDFVRKVFDAETKADETHRELSRQVAEGAFFGGVREDILNLMERIDDIADSAKDAARFLVEDSHLEREARPVLASESMKAFLLDLKAAAVSLRDLVRALKEGRKAAMGVVHSVEDFEEEADTHKDALLKELFAMAPAMSAVTVIQLRDFVFVADDIADNAEDAGDVILVLLAKGYG
jgi:predicted phosphate transport protein (TIGR00153 family)